MPDITIRNISDKTLTALRIKATANDRSMEEEARDILCRAVIEGIQHSGLGSRIAARFAAEGKGEMNLPERGAVRGAKRSTQRPSPDLG